MTIQWTSFAIVVSVSLVSACLLVALFSTALRLGDGTAGWRRPVAIAIYVVCVLIVLVGLVIIIPPLRTVFLSF
jgi:hypothetical protein